MKLKPVLPNKIANYGTLNLPVLQQAVNQIVHNLKCPPALAQWVAVFVANASSHALVDVRNPRGFTEPTSVYIFIVANSGEGKSPVEGVLKRGVTRFEAAERARHVESLRLYNEEAELFEVTRQALATEIRRAIKDRGDVMEAEAALLAHMRTRPIRPKSFRPCLEYVTPEAWIKLMSDNVPVSSLSSSEAAAIMNGRTFNILEFYNQAWSGGPLSVDTKKDGNLSVNWCRLAMGLMIQPEPLIRLLSGKGQAGKDNGFFARTLVCAPSSTQGSRFVQDGTASWDHCDVFTDRSEQLLNLTAVRVREEEYEPEVLEFSPEASAHFFEIHNGIEAQISVGGRYERSSDHATKLSSNIARVAATLHYFENFEGKISLETLRAAQILCEDASVDYLKHFVPLPREILDAIALNNLFDGYRRDRQQTVPMNFARRRCPNAQRTEGRFDLALEILLQEGIVKKTTDMGGTTHLILSPAEYHPFPYAGIAQFGGK